MAGRPACRSSSSAPTKAGATATSIREPGQGAEEPEILEAFLGQFYDDKEPPRLILLSHAIENPDLVAELLSDRAGRQVEIAVPQRGEKAELVENAARNARESLARKMSESATQSKLLNGLAEAFDLDAPPKRIEVYDNSHIQGTNAVGGMIVAGAEGFHQKPVSQVQHQRRRLAPATISA